MTAFETCVDRLTKGERHRVWSLIVTVFGDLAQGADDRISMQSLARITDPIGVKPEALRVALHRLRKDGWIDSRRQGRSSQYHLTEFGREQSVAAAARIYRAGPPDGKDWSLALASHASSTSQREMEELALKRETVPLSANAMLVEGEVDTGGSNLLWTKLDPDNVPDWVKSMTIGAEAQQAYSDLLSVFLDISKIDTEDLDAFEIATLRSLIVHSWRRVLLRHPDVPNFLLPDDCALGACRDHVSTLLARLPRTRTDEIKAAPV